MRNYFLANYVDTWAGIYIYIYIYMKLPKFQLEAILGHLQGENYEFEMMLQLYENFVGNY